MWSASLVVLISVLAACGEVDDSTTTPLPNTFETESSPNVGEVSMDGGALGGNAQTTLLAQEVLIKGAYSGNLAWVAYETKLAAGERQEHTHEFAFVYAKEGAHILQEGPESHELTPTEGATVLSNAPHGHEATDGPSVFWEVRLAAPGSAPPKKASNASLVFESELLEGIPSKPLAAFVHVLVPSGGRTSVHTHPGPELIYQLSGSIEYENALIGSREMGPGEIEGIPPQVAVQKRNSLEDDAEFLSWFLVDLAEPFASPARFAVPAIRGENIALTEKGALVAGVSSNYGGGANNSTFGADNALDGDPSTEWSSDGDGDEGWIEIELPTETHITAIGFWTRTMGTSAQVFSFRVVTDRGEVFGPFDMDDAASIHHFETDLTAKRLRFENIDTSGGNTGALEVEVYGDPVP